MVVKRGRPNPKKNHAMAALTMQLPPVPENLLVRHPNRWVTVSISLMGFSVLDGTLRLPQEAPLRVLEATIIADHGGSISSVTLWHDRIDPRCVIRDMSLRLKDVFQLDDACPRQLHDGSDVMVPAADHEVMVFYDYQPLENGCPLLRRSPRYDV